MDDGQESGSGDGKAAVAEGCTPLDAAPSNVVPFSPVERRKQIEDECSKEVNKVLQHYGCRFFPILGLTADGRICLVDLEVKLQ